MDEAPARDGDGDGVVGEGTAASHAAGGLRDFGDARATRHAVYDRVLAAARAIPPIANARHALKVEDVGYEGPAEYSLAEEKRAILEGRSLARRLKGTFVLADAGTGEVVDRRRTTLAAVPYVTPRGTFIRNGTEFTLANQLRLKAGVYVRRRGDGATEAHVNVLPGKGLSSRVSLDPESGVFRLEAGQAKLPLVSVLRAIGATDPALRAAWGTDLAHANMLKDDPQAATKLHARLARGDVPGDPAARDASLASLLAAMPLDPEVTRATLGKPHDKVSLDALLDASKKVLAVHRGEAEPDDRDHLAYMTLHGPEDLLAERVAKDRMSLGRALWRASRAGGLKGLPPGLLSRSIEAAIQSSGLGSPIEEVNPAQVLEQQGRVSRMGDGGIPSVAGIPESSRAVQPSQFGFVDPLVTPESMRAGVDSRLATAARKGPGGEIRTTAFRDLQGRPLSLTPAEAAARTIAFPGELASGSPTVVAMRGGKAVDVLRGEVDAEMPHFRHGFGAITNLVPMFAAVKPQRAVMAGRMITQALPVVDPEAPLVRAGVPGEETSYDAKYGEHFGALRSKVHGTVQSVSAGSVVVLGHDGRVHAHELYNAFPFNRKTYYHQSAAVRPGDAVAPGQLLARSNYTDHEGTAALGKNARVAFVPYRGENFEDAISISESFAKRLTSEHLYQHELDLTDGAVRAGRKPHTAVFPGVHGRDVLEKFDDEGAVRPGTVVEHGHPLVLAVRRRQATHGSLHKSRKAAFSDASVAWDHHAPGVVTDVAKTPKGILVTVKSHNVTVDGDKIAGRHGNKGVVRVVADHRMPHDKDGRPYEVAMNPLGTISRCYDEATEFRTRRGWVLGIDVREDDELLCFDRAEGDLCWHPQTAPFHVAEYRGPMCRFVGPYVDLLVTPGHTMWAAYDEKAAFYRENPGAMLFAGWQGGPPVWRTYAAHQMVAPDYLIPAMPHRKGGRHDWDDRIDATSKFKPCKASQNYDDPAAADYDGLVFCPTVPTGFVVTRRNGKVQVAGNTNPAQHVEAALGKIAALTGRPYTVHDFDRARVPDLTAFARQELARHGLDPSSTEPVFDPIKGRRIQDPTTGADPQTGVMYLMKLHHTSESKAQGRGTAAYTSDGEPAKGGAEGSKRLSLMDLNALLSHGATHFIRDAGLSRAQAQPERWARFMAGHDSAPPPERFVHAKFLASLRAAGINPRREGARTRLLALTPADVDALAGGRDLENAETVDWREGLKPVKGGLFDEAKTGGHGGDRFAAIRLHEPMPSPAFEEPLRRVLGLTRSRFREVLAGRAPLGDHGSGPGAIRKALDAVDVPGAIARARSEIAGGNKGRREDAIRRLRYLKSADALGLHPRDWVWPRAPVLPPKFRPVSTMQGSGLPLVADANATYRELWEANEGLKSLAGKVDDVGDERLAVYDALKGVVGLGDPVQPQNVERGVRGILQHVFGKGSPKFSTVQRKLLGSTVDLVGRGVIAPDPGLSMDQVGLPEDKAWATYKPFVIRSLVRKGVPRVRAAQAVADREPMAREALLAEFETRPVVVSRAPVLHRYGAMGFKPVLVGGDTIRMPPLVYKGYGADNDGDAVTYHVPLADEASREVLEKMLPSKNLLAVSDFRAHQLPSQEYGAGLHTLSTAKRDGTRPRTFATIRDLARAYARGEVGPGDPVRVVQHGQ